MYEFKIIFVGGVLNGKTQWVDDLPATISTVAGTTYYLHERNQQDEWEYKPKPPKGK